MGGYSLPLYSVLKHTTEKADVCTGPCVVYAVQIKANGADCDVELTNATTDTGIDELMYSVLDGDTILFDYSMIGGIDFPIGLTITEAGGTPAILLWTDKPQVAG